MYPDRKRIYTVAALFPGALLLALFASGFALGKYLLAAVCVSFAAVSIFRIPKRSIPDKNRREVILLMVFMGPVILMLYYLTGLRFGFYRTPVQGSYLWKYILPYLIIIPSAEAYRSVMLQQKRRAAAVLTYFAMVLLDLMVFSRSGVLQNFLRFRHFAGMILFPAITGNVFYHFLSARYGALPGTLYRLTMALYPYLLSHAPGTPDSMVAFGRLVIPVLILLFLRGLYEKRPFAVSRRRTVAGALLGAVLLVCMCLIIMLISCQFRFGLLVVGSESMTGSINKGDAIIYEAYTGDPVQPGQVAVFRDGQTIYIHRVVDVAITDGQLRLYTKGDANESMDPGFATDQEMVGIVRYKVKYIGFPTIWVRELFQ